MEPRDVERGRPKKVPLDGKPAESGVAAADASEAPRPKQLS